MSWIYEQATGHLIYNGEVVGMGYSGHAEGKNCPAMQDRRGVGPIPRGLYTISTPFDDDDHGKYVMRLWPNPKNQMFGRAGFLMHGDSIEHPGAASEGCIVMPRSVREQVWESGDKTLQVVDAYPSI